MVLFGNSTPCESVDITNIKELESLLYKPYFIEQKVGEFKIES